MVEDTSDMINNVYKLIGLGEEGTLFELNENNTNIGTFRLKRPS